MSILLSFAPFIAFALVDRFVGSLAGLVAGAAAAGLLVLHEVLVRRRAPKLLEVGTLLLFAGLAAYAALAAPDWSVLGVRLRVDAGLLLVILFTLAIGRPFTLQYAREQVAPEFWSDPRFLQTNVVISAVWALAFAVLVLADLVMMFWQQVPLRAGIVATVLALVGAARFTAWYPKRATAAADGGARRAVAADGHAR